MKHQCNACKSAGATEAHVAKKPAGAGRRYVAPVVLLTGTRLYTLSPSPIWPIGPVLFRITVLTSSRYEFLTYTPAPWLRSDGGELIVLPLIEQLVSVMLLVIRYTDPPACSRR